MDNTKLPPVQPRSLRYRSHYRIYMIFFFAVTLLLTSFWSVRVWQLSWQMAMSQHPIELILSCAFFIGFGLSYFFWLKYRLRQSVQVFEDHLLLHRGKSVDDIKYCDVESVSIICWSLFYLKMKNGHKHYFNSSIERVDYIWEGVHAARPELFLEEEYEKFRLNLVQYDHHQKRKEWFFRHKLVDVMNWCFAPMAFIGFAYYLQSHEVVIHQPGLYFFRLSMYALLILLVSSFFYSMVLKKLIFDKIVANQLKNEPGDKFRNLQYEGVVVQRSKVFQTITACFFFALIIKTDINLLSVTKLKGDVAQFNMKGGKTLVVDNRFNCVSCRYKLQDGDMVLFGRGIIGQVLAKEGDLVGEVAQDTSGRTIANTNVHEVPRGHVAVKSANGKDILFVKIDDLIGKIQN